MDESAKKKFETVVRELKALPDHDPEAISAAAKRLRAAGYRAFSAISGKDFLSMTAEDVKQELAMIAEAGADALKKTPTPQELWDDSSPAAVERNRILRFEFLMREYRNLYILRNSGPGAEDLISELAAE